MTSLSCKRTLVLLERFVDGDLPPERASRVQEHVQHCDDCRAELAAAQRVQAGLRALPRYRCPEAVAATVLAHVAAESRPAALEARGPARGGWRERLGRGLGDAWWRPALATASVAATALCITWLARQPTPPAASAADLARAGEEVRWALAYVAQVTRDASDSALETTVGEIMGHVIGERVVAPVTKAVRRPLEEDRTP